MRILISLIVITLHTGILLGQTFQQKGFASYYADKYEGHQTANGEKYKHSKLTAAHKTLPFGTVVKVKNLKNGREVTVRINDRGPFVEGRIIDLSKSAATALDFLNEGITEVEISAVSNPKEEKKAYSTLDKPTDSNEIVAKDYFAISAQKKILSGFGVQVGSFTEMTNLVQLVSDLQKKYNDRIFIQVSVIQDVKYYKLIIGNLNSRDKADKLNSKLQQNFSGSYVIKF